VVDYGGRLQEQPGVRDGAAPEDAAVAAGLVGGWVLDDDALPGLPSGGDGGSGSSL
jgi:hypothetical protein